MVWYWFNILNQTIVKRAETPKKAMSKIDQKENVRIVQLKHIFGQVISETIEDLSTKTTPKIP